MAFGDPTVTGWMGDSWSPGCAYTGSPNLDLGANDPRSPVSVDPCLLLAVESGYHQCISKPGCNAQRYQCCCMGAENIATTMRIWWQHARSLYKPSAILRARILSSYLRTHSQQFKPWSYRCSHTNNRLPQTDISPTNNSQQSPQSERSRSMHCRPTSRETFLEMIKQTNEQKRNHRDTTQHNEPCSLILYFYMIHFTPWPTCSSRQKLGSCQCAQQRPREVPLLFSETELVKSIRLHDLLENENALK